MSKRDEYFEDLQLEASLRAEFKKMEKHASALPFIKKALKVKKKANLKAKCVNTGETFEVIKVRNSGAVELKDGNIVNSVEFERNWVLDNASEVKAESDYEGTLRMLRRNFVRK